MTDCLGVLGGAFWCSWNVECAKASPPLERPTLVYSPDPSHDFPLRVSRIGCSDIRLNRPRFSSPVQSMTRVQSLQIPSGNGAAPPNKAMISVMPSLERLHKSTANDSRACFVQVSGFHVVKAEPANSYYARFAHQPTGTSPSTTLASFFCPLPSALQSLLWGPRSLHPCPPFTFVETSAPPIPMMALALFPRKPLLS